MSRIFFFIIVTHAKCEFCSIDLEYIDPRPEQRKEVDAKLKQAEEEMVQAAGAAVEGSEGGSSALPTDPDLDMRVSPPRPDWGQSPLHVSLLSLAVGVFLR